MSAAQRIARNALLNSSSRAWGFLVAILLTPFLLFKLGTEDFAIWSLTYVPVMALASLDLGLNVTLTRFVAGYWVRRDLESGPELAGFIATAFWLSLGLDVVIAGTILLLSNQYLTFLNVPPSRLTEARFVLLITAAVFAVTNAFTLFQAGLYGLQRLDWAAGIDSLTTVLFAAGAIAALESGWGLYGLILVAAGVQVANAFLFTFAFRRFLPRRLGGGRYWSSFNIQAAREMLSYGARVQVTSLGGLASTQFGKILAGHFLSLSSVAAYELGLRVAFNVTFLPVWSMAAVLPVASEMAGLPDRARLLELYRRGTKYVWISATLLAGLVWLTAPQVLEVWTGTPQPEAALVARWLAAAFAINLVTAVGTTIARGIGRAGLETRYSLLVLVMQLTCTVSLARAFGLVGLLFANASALALGSAYFVFLFHRELRQSLLSFIRQILFKPVIVTLPLMALGMLLIGQVPLSSLTGRPLAVLVLGLAAGIYAAFYVAGLGALGYFQASDLMILKGAVKRFSASSG